jgi:AsmA protein
MEWLKNFDLKTVNLKKIIDDKRVKIAGGVVAGLLALAALVPLLVDANKFVPQIESQLTASLGRPVKLGHLSLNMFKVALVANNLTVADDPAYSSQPFLQAKSLNVGVELLPLLLHKQLKITKFKVVSPSMQLIENAAGKWNFSTIGTGSATQAAQPQTTSAPTMTVGTLAIEDAQLSVQTLPASTVHVYSNVNISVKNFSFTSAFPFTLTAELPGGGKLKLSGNAGPIDQTDNTLTPLTADLALTHFSPVNAGFLDAKGGVDGLLDVTAHLASDGKVAQLDGRVIGNKMRFAAKASPSSSAITVDFSTGYTLATQTGQLTKGSIHTDSGAGSVNASVTGNYLLKPADTEIHMALSAPGLSVDGLQTLLPAFGVTLPNGSGLKGGTLSTNLKIDGPVGSLVIAGPVDLKDSSLEGFNLASKLGGLPLMNKLGGSTGSGTSIGSGTRIESLHADINMTEAQLATNNVDVVVPALGQATGDGVILPDGRLNYKMQAKLSALNGLGSLASGLSSLLGGRKNTSTGDAGGIPLLIGGTTSSPSFKLDTSALGFGKPSGGSSTSPANKLKGLFGR